MLVAAHELDVNTGSEQVYNAMDCCLTHEIYSTLSKQMSAASPAYPFELSLQAPVLEMMLRGMRVNPRAREEGIVSTKKDLERLDYIINALAHAIWDTGLNPNSGKQLKELFYEHLGITPIRTYVKGELKYPMDRKVLEKISDYFQARPIVAAILDHRDLGMQLQLLETEVDSDWRMRTSYNIGGTRTGRFSSSKSPTGSGGNLQNVSEPLRHIFIPDPGMVLCGIDAEQSDSRMIGFMCGLLFGDWTYLDACESGDLHTSVARMVWTELPWTGDLKKDRKIANMSFYRHHSYRDASKHLGHGCLTTDHEVLTKDGWVSIAEKPSVIMQFDPITKKSSFVAVTSWIDKMWEGSFCTWDNLSISAKMTSPHRVYYTTTTDEVLLVTAASNVPNSARIPLGGGYIGGQSFSEITPEIARLIAAYQCDGNYGGAGKQARFHMKKIRKFARLEDLARQAGVLFSQGEDKTKAAITIENIRDWPKRAGAYLLTWTKEALEAYLDELPFWDGASFVSSTTATKSLALCATDMEHLDWIRTCNRLVGKGGNISKPYTSGFGSIVYRLQINNRAFTTVEPSQRITTMESNRVFCPSVPAKAFYIRRKGKISITGNTNFLGKPYTMSKETHIPTKDVQKFTEKYFAAFSCIQKWQVWTASELQSKQQLVSIHGRKRDFFDRTNADETIRKGLAFLAAAATADNLDIGMFKIWRHMPEVQLLAQVHDAVYFQFPEELDRSAVVAKAQRLLELPLIAPNNRRFVVPSEAKLGYNWGNYIYPDEAMGIPEKNPMGLRKFIPH